MSEEENESNVVALPRKPKPAARGILQVHERGECDHRGATYIVDEKLATVECSRCKAKLNPTWVLLQLGHAESRWMQTRQEFIEVRNALPNMKRTKCRHCGKFTELRFGFDGETIRRIQCAPWTSADEASTSTEKPA